MHINQKANYVEMKVHSPYSKEINIKEEILNLLINSGMTINDFKNLLHDLENYVENNTKIL